MNKLYQEGEHLDRPVREDQLADSLIRQLVMAHEINSRARSLLHADTQSDAAIDTLENLRHITGVKTLSVFKKHLGEDGDMRFEWRCRTGSASTDRDAWQLSSLEGAACERLAAKKPVRVALAESGATVNQDVGGDGCKPGLIIPINVFGAWWGGLCVDYGATEVDKDTPVSESFATAADFLGVFFERQIASRETAESDKLVGALEMAGTVCHKLNQPMQVILGYASMVTSGDISDPDQVCDIVKMIEDETRRMGIITKNLMGITKYRTVETPDVGSMCDVDSPSAIS